MQRQAETMRDIALRVAEQHRLSLEDITGPCTARRYSWPRQRAMAEIRRTGRYSTTQIGRFFGGRDHTTVLHACERVKERDQ